jgi:hypothetical protein
MSVMHSTAIEEATCDYSSRSYETGRTPDRLAGLADAAQQHQSAGSLVRHGERRLEDSDSGMGLVVAHCMR